PGRSIIDLDSGKIAVAVAKDKMRPGDQIEVRTPNAVAAVRGTVFVVEVLRASAATSQAQAGVTTNVFAFAGALVLTVGNQSLNLLPNTFATATGIGLNSGPITPQMRASALAGLSPTGTQPVEGGNTAAKNAAMGATVATFTSGTLPITSLVLPAAPPPPSIPTPFPGSNKGSTTTLEGHVTAARTATPQPVALKFKDDVFVNDRVVTGDRSLARLLLGGRAVVTVRERSALTITELPGRSTIDLDSGKIAVAVAKDKMRPGDQIEVRTPN